jgi:ribonuclease I
LYAWQIDSKATFSRRLQWSTLAAEPTRWRLAYRALPDEQTIDFIPGVGISRFEYVHHGTTATIDVHLSTVTSRPR